MRISYNWLREYVNIKLSAEKLAGILTMAGLAVESAESFGKGSGLDPERSRRVEKADGDTFLEIEVTSNRPDLLSYIGVAREIAAITGGKLKSSSVRQLAGSPVSRLNRQTGQPANRPTVKVSDKRLCPRYTARIIRNVKVDESPVWLKTKIEAMGLRPVNNIVDITNFCLFETGEPMHAFDLDRLEGGGIIVRKARSGEKITAIDGVLRTLEDSMLVIADAKGAVAIAGVMGGLDTEVSASTKNILLEAAFFDPVSVRRTARKIAISTESSYRFERRVDAGNIRRASDRAAALIKELAGGEIDKLFDIGTKKEIKKVLNLRYSRCGKIIGVDIAPAKIKKILASLGLKAKGSSKDGIKLEMPHFRYDLKSEIDIIEEVARIYGYDNVPSTIPQIVEDSARIPVEMIVDKKIRECLTGFGMDEIITYSLLGKKALSSAAVPDGNIVEIANPLTAEQEVMRPNLMIGMLASILWNINRKTKDLALFELGNIYLKEGNTFKERKHLSMAMAGEISNWLRPTRERSFYDLKGAVEGLLSELGVAGVSFKEARLPEAGTNAVGQARHEGFSPLACATIEIEGARAGVIGEIDKKTAANFDIKEKIYYCELCIGMVLKHAALEKHFSAIPKYPSVCRDISIVVPKNVTNTQLESLARDSGSPVLKTVILIDRYRGKQIPDEKTSLTYRLEYQDLKKTLTEKDISDVHARILRSLEEKFGAQLRY
jgi:phenylalanyl-tRNA synthetase beta chain